MNAQQTNIEVIANNIANINSTSYKRARAEFTDLFYQMDRMQGVSNVSGSSPIPEGANLGLGAPRTGTTVVRLTGNAGYGKINQQYLEASNVDPVKEITELISAQRAYEMNAKVIQASDEMASTVSKGLR